MHKSRKLTYCCFFIWSLVCLLISFIFYNIYQSKQKAFPKVTNGVLDLTKWDFDKNGIVPLNGQWKFYNKLLLSHEDFKNSHITETALVDIPSYFRWKHVDSTNIPNQGYGTYRITVKTNSKHNYYALRTESVNTTHRLWVDNTLVTSAGIISQAKEYSIPQIVPQSGNFINDDKDFDIILQTSNYEAKFPQIDSILLGTEEQILKYKFQKLAFDFFIFGSTFIMGIYNLSLYNNRKKDKTPLMFSMFCFILALRTLFVGERFIISIFPNLNWQIHMKICYTTFLTYITVFLLCISEYYKGVINPRLIKFSKISTLVYLVGIIILPPAVYEYLIIPYEIISILILIYILCILTMLWIYKKENSFLIIIGTVAILITNINDILHEFSLIHTGFYAALGLIVFIVIQSYVVAKIFSKTFIEVEEMSEKLKSADKLKDEFIADISQSLKNPLSGIISLSESMLLDNNLNKDQLINISLISSTADRLSNMVNYILDFAKLNNNEIKLMKKSVNLKKTVQLAILNFYPSAKDKNLKIYNNISDNLPEVLADENIIKQIFFNLIGNSIKFTQNGYVSISAYIDGNLLKVSIEDTGKGIPTEKIHNIFNAHQEPIDEENFVNTCMSLTLTRKLIELHGGSLYVKSSLGVGSKFTFTLPIYENSKNSENSLFTDILNNFLQDNIDCTNKKLNNDGKKYKILIVDDEPLNLRLLKNFLVPQGFYVITAFSGKNALEIINADPNIDLVILDIVLPDMLGYELCSILRERYSLFSLPVLMLTSDNKPQNLIFSFQYGANDYLKKPLDKSELIARVETLIALKYSVKNELNLQKQVSDTNKKVEKLQVDMTKNQKKLYEIIEYDKIKTEFFANISHELRTPLNVIWSTLQLINTLDSNLTLGENNIKKYCNIMKQNCLRLIRLINNLIDITKLDGNYLSLEIVNQNIVCIVEDIALSVAKYVESQGISLIFDTDVEEKIMAFDSDKIERIILNLLSNAVKFTPKGGTIKINMWDLDDKIKISVEDNGIGIPEDKLSLIFDRFAQVDKSLSRKNEGSGIGLSLVKSLVELHNGTITVKSTYGKGSEFIIELPAAVKKDCFTKTDDYISQDGEYSRYIDRVKIEFSDIYM